MVQGNAFDFLERPPRDQKPRQRGLTVASDRGMSLEQAKSIIETTGDILDHIKCPDHVGNMWRWPADWIKRKNDYYAGVGIHTLPGGIPAITALLRFGSLFCMNSNWVSDPAAAVVRSTIFRSRTNRGADRLTTTM